MRSTCPEDLLGRTQSVLADGSAYEEVAGDAGTCPERLTLLVRTV
ncbi:hypothetical protein QA942_01885 [Streptomyces sp. B21-106]